MPVYHPVPKEQKGKQYWEAQLREANELVAAGWELRAKADHWLSLFKTAALPPGRRLVRISKTSQGCDKILSSI